MRLLFLLCLISSPLLSFAQVLPASRSVNWELAGYRGDIPDYPAVVDITDYGGVADGATANDSAFAHALEALAGEEGVIFFPAGTYLFHSKLSLHSGLILRGASADSTTLKFDLATGNSSDAILISGRPTTITTALSADAGRDSSFLQVDDAAGFSAGDYLRLSFNDSNLIFSSWAYGSVGQIIKIKDIVGDKIFLESPLRLDYYLSGDPKITRLDMVTGVGIECLKIYRSDATEYQASNITFHYAAQCWVSGIESEQCNFAHVEINTSTNISVTGSYFHDAHAYGGGGQGYGILCQATSGECLIEDNIFKHLRHSMLLQFGANGNVFGYNYSIDPYWDEPILPANSAGDLVLHGNHPYANLFEGNIGQNIVIDDSHGENGPFNTFFRNRAGLFGIFMNNNPPSDSQNFIGNEVTHSDFGLYFLNGKGHFQHGNNIRGTIRPAGTDTLSDTSYYNHSLPAFLQHVDNWPAIGIPNTIKSGTIPAKERYLAAQFTTCSQDPTTGLDEIHTTSLRLLMFPNPASGLVYVSPSGGGVTLIAIYDCTGRLKGQYEISDITDAIDLSSYPKGVYIVKASTKEHSYSPLKLVIR